MNKKRLFAVLMCVAMIASLFTACGGGAAEDDAVTVTIAMADEFTTIDPMETSAETNQIVQDLIFDMLTDTDLTKMENAGELLESWEMVTPKEWNFKLKEGIMFSDGTECNTDDVFFTFERGKEHSAASGYIAKMESWEKIDDYNFKIILAGEGDVDFNYTFAANQLSVFSKEAFETMPEEEAILVGTGLYKLDEFVSGDHVTLVRSETCTLYEPTNVEKIVFKMMPEASSRMIALENGEVDLIMSPDATDYARLESTEGLQLLKETGRTQHFICFNQKNADSIVTDPTFRLACAYAIDKDEMILAAWDGNALKSTSVQCRDVEFYADLEGIPYDPEKAKELFEECGAVGKTISLVTSDAAHRVKIAENFQAQMAEYGITISCEFMQQAALMELCTSDGTTSGTEIIVMSWTPGKNGDYMYRNTTHSTGGRNYAQFNDPELDALIDKAAACEDKVERAALYKELQETLTYDVVGWIPIAQHDIFVGSNTRVEGVLLHPALVHSFKYVNVVEE